MLSLLVLNTSRSSFAWLWICSVVIVVSLVGTELCKLHTGLMPRHCELVLPPAQRQTLANACSTTHVNGRPLFLLLRLSIWDVPIAVEFRQLSLRNVTTLFSTAADKFVTGILLTMRIPVFKQECLFKSVCHWRNFTAIYYSLADQSHSDVYKNKFQSRINLSLKDPYHCET